MKHEDLLLQENHFSFGKNWQDFATKINEDRIAQVMSDLSRLTGRDRLDGLRFLDIGCGSGLHALAAHRLGAREVVGTDIDPDSVAASRNTFARFASIANARFETTTVFDMTPEAFGTFDIVYSWGVLHHTGDMNRAIAIAVALVMPDGEFLVALYKKTPFCGIWRVIKRRYSRASTATQRRFCSAYVALTKIAKRVRGVNFGDYVANYGRMRGMDFHNDVHDWMGGYPYQSISPEECRELLKGLGFAVTREFVQRPGRYLPGLLGTGCDEYAFGREQLDGV